MNTKMICVAGALALSVSVSGCAANAYALMKGPTGEIKECKVDPWGDIQYQRQVDQCVDSYTKAGFKKVN